MVSTTIQTVLVLAGPFLIPRVYRVLRRSISSRSSPSNTSNNLPPLPPLPPPRPIPRSLQHIRLLIFTLGLTLSLSLALVFPPSNLFLTLAPSHSLPQLLIPTLRTPIDIRTPTTVLSDRLLAHSNQPTLAPEQEALLSAMQTLDARIVYTAVGASPLLYCNWCYTPSSDKGARDFMLYNLPGLGVEYILVLAATKVLGGMRRWVLGALLTAMVGETWFRVSWVPMAGHAAGGVMVHSQSHLLRHLFFSLLFLVSFFFPPSQNTQRAVTATSYLEPQLKGLGDRLEAVVELVRTMGLVKGAVGRNEALRDTNLTNQTKQTRLSVLAQKDPTLQALRSNAALSEVEREAFEGMIERVLGRVLLRDVNNGEGEGNEKDRKDGTGGEENGSAKAGRTTPVSNGNGNGPGKGKR
ncbi:hypothetical protein T439DRAFT_348685 [Meredithblackwellia eburnea MCA 4105]